LSDLKIFKTNLSYIKTITDSFFKKKDMTLRVGIIGASGIGFTHARHYNELGANIVAVLCSSEQNAKIAADKLKQTYNTHAEAYHNLNDFLDEELDAVSICTPPALHIDHITACFDKNIPVFCEKPLFWNKSMSLEQVYQQLSYIESHKNRRLFVNTSNTVFMDTILQIEDNSLACKKLSFEFFTNGPFQGISIAQDLLPHGLSLLIHKMGNFEIVNFNFNVSTHSFSCNFFYGECLVNFDFRQNPEGPRHMRIGLNENSYSRFQSGNGITYEVSLINDKTKEIIPVQDPFRVFISRFLEFASHSESKKEDEFKIGALNLSLMAKCLNLIGKCV